MNKIYKLKIFNFIFNNLNQIDPRFSYEDGLDFLFDVFGEFPEDGGIQYSIQKYNKSGFELIKKWAEKYEKLGLDLFMVTDDSDIYHFLAMPKEYAPLVRLIRKKLGFQFLEPFNSIDLEWYE